MSSAGVAIQQIPRLVSPILKMVRSNKKRHGREQAVFRMLSFGETGFFEMGKEFFGTDGIRGVPGRRRWTTPHSTPRDALSACI